MILAWCLALPQTAWASGIQFAAYALASCGGIQASSGFSEANSGNPLVAASADVLGTCAFSSANLATGVEFDQATGSAVGISTFFDTITIAGLTGPAQVEILAPGISFFFAPAEPYRIDAAASEFLFVANAGIGMDVGGTSDASCSDGVGSASTAYSINGVGQQPTIFPSPACTNGTSTMPVLIDTIDVNPTSPSFLLELQSAATADGGGRGSRSPNCP